jgi:hypothetical protein
LRFSTPFLLLLLLAVSSGMASGQDPVPGAGPERVRIEANPTGRDPGNHQDSSFLGHAHSAVMPADGLLTVGLGYRTYSSVYRVGSFPERISQSDLFLRLESGPLPWLQVMAEVPYRSWSDGSGWIPGSGSGLADGRFRVLTGRPLLGGGLNAALFAGGNLPLGSEAEGLTEGVFSPRVGAALTWRLFRNRQAPEMRLHLNYSQRWNKAEDTGYGVGRELLEPWFPRYPAASTVGGDGENDQTTLAAAVEVRKGTTSFWLEYIQDRFPATDAITPEEQFTGVGAGVRWGVMNGWAVRAEYLVSLAMDDHDTAWDPAYPEMVTSVLVTRQLAIGGRDQDRDGVPDREDFCPLRAEDEDGWQDGDGCPDDDNDEDGIPDAVDAAPNLPEDYDGWQDHDGMPEPDNDGDGIMDWADACPDEAEDLDGYKDDDGCPEEFADRDGDGIEDSRDSCPDTPEDLDGFEDGDGCPEEDNDLDGIPDIRDACPDEPEDYDGVEDEDGCPEGEKKEKADAGGSAPATAPRKEEPKP